MYQPNGIDKTIPLDQIRPGRFQPRRDFEALSLYSLAASIREQGLLNRVLVFLREDGCYELLAGERRWRAHCALALAPELEEEPEEGLGEAVGFVSLEGWPDLVARGDWQHALAKGSILASELAADLDPASQQTIAVIDNLQREDLNPIEEAQALKGLKKGLKLSLRALAAKVGKSKSYVEDRLKLLDLSDEVARMVASDDEAQRLDLGLAREIARKIPEPLQAPLVECLQRLDGPIETAQLLKAIGQMGRFVELNRWSLTHDTDIPHHPAYANRARLIRRLLETTPAAALAAALVELWGRGGYSNFLNKKVDSLLRQDWDFRRVANILHGGQGDAWEAVAGLEGWGCDSCALRQLHGAIDQGMDGFDWHVPCPKLRRFAEPEEITTCPGYVGPDDPQVIVVQSPLLEYLDEKEELLHSPLQGADDSQHYAESWTDYHHLYLLARQNRQQAREAKDEAEQSAHLAPMLAYWEAQQGETFDLAHPQAHACQRCVNFVADAPAGQPPCVLAAQPLLANKRPRPPDYGVWVSEAGVSVPRCERFTYADRPAIQRSFEAGFAIADRELVLSWYNQLTDNLHDHRAKTLKIYGPLRWLTGPRQNLAKLWQEIGDDDLMMTLLNIGVIEAANGGGYTMTYTLEAVDITGERCVWQVLEWDWYTGQKKPYHWPDDWPLPW